MGGGVGLGTGNVSTDVGNDFLDGEAVGAASVSSKLPEE